MKFSLILILLSFCLIGHAQQHYKIELSEKINGARMGVWVHGDYKIFVDLDSLETNFRVSAKRFEDRLSYYDTKDSEFVKYYIHSSKRYLVAADQIKNSKNGFDLHNVILYDGVEEKKLNTGNSGMVLKYIKQLTEKGQAIVMYKGKRVYTLNYQYESKHGAGVLDHGLETKTYVDDIENCIFTEYQHVGW